MGEHYNGIAKILICNVYFVLGQIIMLVNKRLGVTSGEIYVFRSAAEVTKLGFYQRNFG